jgi:hypothetical protein
MPMTSARSRGSRPAARRMIAFRSAVSKCGYSPIDGPAEFVLYVPTQGASIGYTTEEGTSPKWRLYTGPILVDAPMTLRAKAIRYGYKESAETRVTPHRPRADRPAATGG